MLIRGVVPSGSVTLDGFDVTTAPAGLTAVATAVFMSWPASRSACVITCEPRHTTVEVGAGAGSMRLLGQERLGTCGSVTARPVGVLEARVGDCELVRDHAADHDRIRQRVGLLDLLDQVELVQRRDGLHDDVADQVDVGRSARRARPAELVGCRRIGRCRDVEHRERPAAVEEVDADGHAGRGCRGDGELHGPSCPRGQGAAGHAASWGPGSISADRGTGGVVMIVLPSQQ